MPGCGGDTLNRLNTRCVTVCVHYQHEYQYSLIHTADLRVFGFAPGNQHQHQSNQSTCHGPVSAFTPLLPTTNGSEQQSCCSCRGRAWCAFARSRS